MSADSFGPGKSMTSNTVSDLRTSSASKASQQLDNFSDLRLTLRLHGIVLCTFSTDVIASCIRLETEKNSNLRCTQTRDDNENKK